MNSTTVALTAINEVSVHFASICDMLERNGFALISGLPADPKSLRDLAHYFGDIQQHVRSDDSGVVGDGSSKTGWEQHREEYQGLGEQAFSPHTDGAFLDGVHVDGSRAYVVSPPRMLLLQCVQQSESGGDSVLIEVSSVLSSVMNRDLDVIMALLKTQSVTFSRDDMIAHGVSVLDRPSPSSRWRVRMRRDQTLYGTPKALAALGTLYNHYLTNDAFRYVVRLSPGDILAIDNFRCLHGRTGGQSTGGESSTRKMRRVWISEDHLRLSAVGKPRANRSISPYANYATLASPIPEAERIPYECGLRFGAADAQLLNHLVAPASANIHRLS